MSSAENWPESIAEIRVADTVYIVGCKYDEHGGPIVVKEAQVTRVHGNKNTQDNKNYPDFTLRSEPHESDGIGVTHEVPGCEVFSKSFVEGLLTKIRVLKPFEPLEPVLQDPRYRCTIVDALGSEVLKRTDDDDLFRLIAGPLITDPDS